jgi:hypothetical protein
MAGALAAALALTALTFALCGTGEAGTRKALLVTARFSFLLFWPAYVGGALVALFGPVFQPLRRRGRALGLGFASAHSVHAALVVWLCALGAAPAKGVFVVFGIALACMYLLVFASIAPVRAALGTAAWRVLLFCAMNYIAFCFAKDFLRVTADPNAKALLIYLPFVVLSVVGPAIVGAALVLRSGVLHRLPASAPAFRSWRNP